MSDDPPDPDPDDDGPAPRTVREERSLSPMRRTIAERLGESHRDAVHVTLHREVDAEGLLAAVDEAEEWFEVDASPVDVLLLAVSATLDEHPAFNATFDDGVHTTYDEHNVGVAVAVDEGLLVPVLADVGSLSLPDVVAERRRLTGRVRSGDHTMSDLRNGTFTVSNLGPLGVDGFTPIINPPEVAILGVGRLRERARNADDGVRLRRELPLDLSIDHRVVDGADGARFLETLAGHVTRADDLLDGE